MIVTLHPYGGTVVIAGQHWQWFRRGDNGLTYIRHGNPDIASIMRMAVRVAHHLRTEGNVRIDVLADGTPSTLNALSASEHR